MGDKSASRYILESIAKGYFKGFSSTNKPTWTYIFTDAAWYSEEDAGRMKKRLSRQSLEVMLVVMK